MIADESGATLLEYVFVASLISVIAYASLSSISGFLGNTFSTVAANL